MNAAGQAASLPAAGSAAQSAASDRMAAALFDRAALVLMRLSAPSRATPLIWIERFCADPTPGNYLGAVRVLSRAARDQLVDRLDGEGARRSFAEGIAALRAVSAMPDELVAELAADLPANAAEGRRLEALALLLGTYQELAGRVSEDTERLRRALRAAGVVRGRKSRR